MRSALLCVFFTLITRRESIRAQSDDFRPTPIPLNEWHHERREGRAGTLQETFKTDSPPFVAAVPAHYWEDALRHSVYLTLVRDKIDQLIAKGDVISPNSKPDSYDSKEIDDHDLWDKIKTAPFDRIQDEPASFGDVTIMAKGRLLEENGGFRFAEDERTKEKCSREKCMEGVKAFWSVKRVRQRDQETSPGKYHYELTFSVISQIPKKQRKPFENPIRTFTVKESSPNGIIDRPQEHRRFDPISVQTARPERAIWVHKNIAPSRSFTGRKQYFSGLDRIFSSLFSDDDNRSYESPQSKYKPNPYPVQTGSQYSKIGHVGVPVDKYQTPYAYRPHSVQHARPPLQTPPTNPIQHQYLDIGPFTTASSNPYSHFLYDHHVESSQTLKTTRPAVLPTPLPPLLPPKDQSAEVTNTMSIESTAYTPETTKIHKTYNKYKTTPEKLNYLTEHVRPPVYNAPPGVFVTMDKKPFKPMPPLKLHSSKPHRPNKPIDFRPSPQVLDQSSDQGTFSDTAFRPITMNYGDNSSSENGEINYSDKKGENKNRIASTAGKKPLKKHENIKSHRVTTATPDIITVQSSSEEEIETMDWTNILGAFTKTTPMVSQTEKMQVPEATTHMTTTVTATTPKKKITTTTEAVPETTMSTSTTVKPKKRTRPPPKFVKQEKIKKHKRITTTNRPENVIKGRPLHDLTPQASSAATGTIKPFRESMNKTVSSSTSTTSTTITTTTTTKPTTTKITTTTQTPSATTKKSIGSTTQPKNRNRFRQSTLMYKGTSVKHDRWNTIGMQKNQTLTTPTPLSILNRRKGSNFHGYISSTTPRQVDEERLREKNNHADRKSSLDIEENSTQAPNITSQSSLNYEETVDQYESNSVLPIERSEQIDESNKNYDDETKDHTEYIFQATTIPAIKEEESSAEIDTTPYTPLKNKTKCKKKKNNIPMTEQSTDIDSERLTSTTVATTITSRTSSEIPTTNDILQELFNFDFKGNNEETSNKPRSDLDEEESLNHESYLKIGEEFDDFLGVLNSEKEHKESVAEDDEYENDDENDDENVDDDNNSDDDEYEESKIPSIDDDSDFESDDDDEHKKESARFSYKSQKKRPYSFLELMAMS